MSKLVVTNIRLSKAELQWYRQLAQAAGMSLSQFIRKSAPSHREETTGTPGTSFCLAPLE